MGYKDQWFMVYAAAIGAGASAPSAEKIANDAIRYYERISGRERLIDETIKVNREAHARLHKLHVVQTDPNCKAHVESIKRVADALDLSRQ